MCKNEYLSFAIYVIANYASIGNGESDPKADIVFKYWLYSLVD